MRDKTRITAIAGILAYIVAILVLFIPFQGEQAMSLINWHSPLGIVVIAFFVASVVLYGIACFKRELHYPDKEKAVNQRREDLPLLRNSIDAIITRQKELTLEIGKVPIESFFNEYLKIDKDYKRYRRLLNALHKSDEQTKHKLAILLSMTKYFYPKAIHLNNASRDDGKMSELNTEKDIYYRRNNDKKLSSNIDELLTRATQYHSILALTELATNNELSYRSVKNYAVFEEKPKRLEGLMTKAYKAMNDRMGLLMRGDDL